MIISRSISLPDTRIRLWALLILVSACGTKFGENTPENSGPQKISTSTPPPIGYYANNQGHDIDLFDGAVSMSMPLLTFAPTTIEAYAISSSDSGEPLFSNQHGKTFDITFVDANAKTAIATEKSFSVCINTSSTDLPSGLSIATSDTHFSTSKSSSGATTTFCAEFLSGNSGYRFTLHAAEGSSSGPSFVAMFLSQTINIGAGPHPGVDPDTGRKVLDAECDTHSFGQEIPPGQCFMLLTTEFGESFSAVIQKYGLGEVAADLPVRSPVEGYPLITSSLNNLEDMGTELYIGPVVDYSASEVTQAVIGTGTGRAGKPEDQFGRTRQVCVAAYGDASPRMNGMSLGTDQIGSFFLSYDDWTTPCSIAQSFICLCPM